MIEASYFSWVEPIEKLYEKEYLLFGIHRKYMAQKAEFRSRIPKLNYSKGVLCLLKMQTCIYFLKNK